MSHMQTITYIVSIEHYRTMLYNIHKVGKDSYVTHYEVWTHFMGCEKSERASSAANELPIVLRGISEYFLIASKKKQSE